jgi:4,5-DOPA dioxygenase extradiol
MYTNSNIKAPALFVGHGNPMNAIENNNFTRSLSNLEKNIKTPKAILVISAHWYEPYFALSIHNGKLIYDMYGFPKELYDVKYHAKDSDFLISKLKSEFDYIKTENRGLDHGVWSILVHLFPNANIPITQISINSNLSLKEHYELGQKLSKLRDQNIMILASGNITHNLKMVNWQKNSKIQNWAIEFDKYIANAICNKDFDSLINIKNRYFSIAHPTIEHYIPLLYIAGAMKKDDDSQFIYEDIELSSISMRSWLLD